VWFFLGVGIGSGRFGFWPKSQNRPDRRVHTSGPFRTITYSVYFGSRFVRFGRVRSGLAGLVTSGPINFCSKKFSICFYWFGPLAHFTKFAQNSNYSITPYFFIYIIHFNEKNQNFFRFLISNLYSSYFYFPEL
jgi:hypothetical protein